MPHELIDSKGNELLFGQGGGFASLTPNKPLARQASVTIDATVGGVGITAPAGALYAELYVETAQVRFTVDGTTPTTTVGRIANPGDTIKLSTNDFTKFKAIRTGATSGSIQGDYWG